MAIKAIYDAETDIKTEEEYTPEEITTYEPLNGTITTGTGARFSLGFAADSRTIDTVYIENPGMDLKPNAIYKLGLISDVWHLSYWNESSGGRLFDINVLTNSAGACSDYVIVDGGYSSVSNFGEEDEDGKKWADTNILILKEVLPEVVIRDYLTRASFPVFGRSNALYIPSDGKIWRWDESITDYRLSSSLNADDIVNGTYRATVSTEEKAVIKEIIIDSPESILKPVFDNMDNGNIVGIEIINGGAGYAAGNVTILGTNDTPASATYTVDANGTVDSITVVAQGSGYGQEYEGASYGGYNMDCRVFIERISSTEREVITKAQYNSIDAVLVPIITDGAITGVEIVYGGLYYLDGQEATILGTCTTPATIAYYVDSNGSVTSFGIDSGAGYGEDCKVFINHSFHTDVAEILNNAADGKTAYDQLMRKGFNVQGDNSQAQFEAQETTQPAMILKALTGQEDGILRCVNASDVEQFSVSASGDYIRIANTKTPSASNAAGTKGMICYDSSYQYICTGTNSWKRIPLTW